MKIQKVTDEAFKKYGKVVEGISFDNILKEMGNTPLPDGVVYVPSLDVLEATPEAKDIMEKGFGGLPIQIGYCNGHNIKLNAVEYHRSSEIDIAVTDLVLLLGCQQDISFDDTYDTEKIEAFFIEAGTAVELYATTLHYAPCHSNASGFRCVVVLPRGTNEPLNFIPDPKGEIRLITAMNKWLIAHEEANISGAFNGLVGKNISL